MKPSHPWDVTPAEARTIQDRLRPLVVVNDDFAGIVAVAGVDVGFEQGGAVTRAAIAVLGFPGLDPIDQALAKRPTGFPYVPGLLSFREIPAILDALSTLRVYPDLLLCDGQGYAHPRRLGLASHLGLLTDLPSIGVAKSRLIGEHGSLAKERGAWTWLHDGGEIIGAVLRTRSCVRPVYVSIGHRVSLDSAIRFVLACTTRYRLPETTRRAHRLASEQRAALS